MKRAGGARRAGVAIGILLLVAVAVWVVARGPRTLHAVGPLQVSNRTSTPLTAWGHRLPQGAQLSVEVPGGPSLLLDTAREDNEHLGALLPPIPLPIDTVRVRAVVRVTNHDGQPIAGEAHLDIVNDAVFRDPIALAVDARGHTAVVSPGTDELWLDGVPQRVGDGPRHVTSWGGWWVVTLEDAGALQLVHTATPSVTRTIAVGGRPQRTAVDAVRGLGYVSERALDQVVVVDLAAGEVVRRIDVDAQPDALALDATGTTLWISAEGAETIAAVDLTVATATPTRVRMGPSAAIIGGPTAPYAAYVMGGKPARDLVVAGDWVFASTLGPNIGPNPDRMEVSMAGGITVIEARTRRFLRHVVLDRGVAQGLAWDAAAQRLYVADSAAGRVVVFDGAKLTGDDPASAQVAAFEVPVPADVPRIRGAQDLGPAQPRRATDSLHAGPWSLALHEERLYVLERFARTLDLLDPASGALVGRTALDDRPQTQPLRRRGQIVYFTDLGHSRMTCDTCHPDGRDGGLLFTKGQPIQIHRSPSIRSTHDSAPFFTPAKLASLAITARVVLSRNRYDDPPASSSEVAALTEYTRAFSAPRSPFRAGAALPATIPLPDGSGRSGRPLEGRAIFEGRGGCAVSTCHPAPHFTADQAPATRGLFHDVGTPRRLGLRETMQDAAPAQLPPPSLLGVWDNFPLLFSGAAGFSVDGDRVVPDARFALGRALELHTHVPLDARETADLLAYLLTL